MPWPRRFPDLYPDDWTRPRPPVQRARDVQYRIYASRLHTPSTYVHLLGPFYPPGQRLYTRDVVAKLRIVYAKNLREGMTLSANTRAYVLYIERDGAGRGDGKSTLQLSDDRSREDLNPWLARMNADPYVFRLVLSPHSDDGKQLDLHVFVQRVMREYEHTLGLSLDYGYAIHGGDTPHVHVIIRGTDRFGQRVFFPRSFVQHGLRMTATAVVTDELGPLTEAAWQRRLSRGLSLKRFVVIDRWVAHALERAEDGCIDLRTQPSGGFARFRHQMMEARLESLARFGLATSPAHKRWTLVPEWRVLLREWQIEGDFTKTASRYWPHRDPTLCMRFPHNRALPQPLVGRVLQRIYPDDVSDRQALLLDVLDEHKGYYIPLTQYSEPTRVRVGDLVRVTSQLSPTHQRFYPRVEVLSRNRAPKHTLERTV